jgi:hypothetical protein
MEEQIEVSKRFNKKKEKQLDKWQLQHTDNIQL